MVLLSGVENHKEKTHIMGRACRHVPWLKSEVGADGGGIVIHLYMGRHGLFTPRRDRFHPRYNIERMTAFSSRNEALSLKKTYFSLLNRCHNPWEPHIQIDGGVDTFRATYPLLGATTVAPRLCRERTSLSSLYKNMMHCPTSFQGPGSRRVRLQ